MKYRRLILGLRFANWRSEMGLLCAVVSADQNLSPLSPNKFDVVF